MIHNFFSKKNIYNGVRYPILQDKLFGKKSEDEMKNLIEEFKEAVKKDGLYIPGKKNMWTSVNKRDTYLPFLFGPSAKLQFPYAKKHILIAIQIAHTVSLYFLAHT
jgi:hypothetical protein